jgi:DNA-binding transcriptional MerR regulator
MYTVSQLANIAGVSRRTLQYYDSIGLLKPDLVGENGYRYYNRGSILNLQQILFYRELGLPLKKIKEVMSDPSFKILEALENQKMDISKRINRLLLISETIDKTINSLNGGKLMSDKQMFSAFSEEKQEEYTAEAEKKYDPDIISSSNRRWKSYDDKKKKNILKEGNIIYAEMVSLIPQGLQSEKVQAVVERWRKHMDYFWTPNLEQLKGIANNYVIDPGYKENFDKINPDLADFFSKAVNVYVDRLSD